MHFAIVVAGIPNPSTSGAALTHWTIIQQMLQRGHRVTACLLFSSSNPHYRSGKDRRLKALSDLGVDIMEISVDEVQKYQARRPFGLISRVLRPKLIDYYPLSALAPIMKEKLNQIKPDAIFVYEVAVLASLYGVRTAPRLVALVDLDHLPPLYQLRYSQFKISSSYMLSAVATLLQALIKPKFMIKLLSDCETVIDFASHHAAWLKENGVPQCRYMPTPVFDAAESKWLSLRKSLATETKSKILMIGHLHGTATRAGLHLFAKETLPLLEKQLGPDGFEVHIVGGYIDSLPTSLLGLLNRPSVKMRGHIEPADQEFLSADILLVPTPIKLGARVRIIVGFSFGCCVIAHRANAMGIPELDHEYNALLASDGRGLARAVLSVVCDPDLRQRLGANARRTYEENFHPSTASARIVHELERIAVEGK